MILKLMVYVFTEILATDNDCDILRYETARLKTPASDKECTGICDRLVEISRRLGVSENSIFHLNCDVTDHSRFFQISH